MNVFSTIFGIIFLGLGVLYLYRSDRAGPGSGVSKDTPYWGRIYVIIGLQSLTDAAANHWMFPPALRGVAFVVLGIPLFVTAWRWRAAGAGTKFFPIVFMAIGIVWGALGGIMTVAKPKVCADPNICAPAAPDDAPAPQ